MKPIRPLLAAVALTVLASLSPTAPPAGATVLNTGTVTGGTLSFNLVPALTVHLHGGAPAPCPIPPAQRPTMGLDVTSVPPSWNTDVASFATVAPLSFTYGGATWFLVLTRSAVGPHTGTIGTPPGYAWNQSTRLDAQIYPEAAPPGSCIPDLAAPVCPAPFTITYLPGGTFGGRLFGAGIVGETIVGGTTFRLNGPGTVTAGPGCAAPFATLNGRVASLNLMDVAY